MSTQVVPPTRIIVAMVLVGLLALGLILAFNAWTAKPDRGTCLAWSGESFTGNNCDVWQDEMPSWKKEHGDG